MYDYKIHKILVQQDVELGVLISIINLEQKVSMSTEQVIVIVQFQKKKCPFWKFKTSSP